MKYTPSACDEGPGMFAQLLTVCSVLLIGVTLPFSLFFVVKVVQEYERAVIFRLGRLLRGGAKGPGVFFVIPCLDVYEKIDMRTATYDVPPQEVNMTTELERNWLPHFIFSKTTTCMYRSSAATFDSDVIEIKDKKRHEYSLFQKFLHQPRPPEAAA